MKANRTLLILCLSVSIAAGLTSCSSGRANPWDRQFNLRQWEKVRVAAENDFLAERYDRAEELLRLALSYAERISGKDFRVELTQLQLGDVLLKESKLGEARASYQEALAILNGELSKHLTDTDKRLAEEDKARVLLNLGDVCLQSGDLNSSERYYEQAVALQKQRQELGGSHALAEGIGLAYAGLGTAEAKQGKTTEAARVYREALADPAAALYSLSLTDRLQRLSSSSGKSGATAASIDAVQSDDSFRNHLLAAKEAEDSKDFATAERQYSHAVAEGERLGQDAVKMAPIYARLAKTQERLSEFEKAESNYKRALELTDKSGSGSDKVIDEYLTQLGTLSHQRHDDRAACAYFTRQLKRRRQEDGQRSGRVGETLSRLSEISLAQGHDLDAARQALDSWSMLNEDPFKRVRVVLAKERLARVFFALGKYKEAAQANDHILQNFEGRKPPRPRRLMACYRLAALYAQQGESSKAAACGKENADDVATCFTDSSSRLDLINQMNEEAQFIAGYNQLKGGEAYLNWALSLFRREDESDQGFMLAKKEILTNLSTIESKLGNKKKADLLQKKSSDWRQAKTERALSTAEA